MAKHLHTHDFVTREQLDAFADDDEAVQLLVLAELRTRSADQEVTLLPTLTASGIAILAVLLSVLPDSFFQFGSTPAPTSTAARYIAALIVVIVFVAIVLAVSMPSIRSAVIGNRDHSRAAVWLAAYERELDRQRAATGRRARRWRRAHRL